MEIEKVKKMNDPLKVNSTTFSSLAQSYVDDMMVLTFFSRAYTPCQGKTTVGLLDLPLEQMEEAQIVR